MYKAIFVFCFLALSLFCYGITKETKVGDIDGSIVTIGDLLKLGDIIPYVYDSNSNKTAVTIGSRDTLDGVGENSFVLGYKCVAKGKYTHAEGDRVYAEGASTKAEGKQTHAEGFFTHAEGKQTHAEGDSTHAEGVATHAEGYDTHAEGDSSNAEGVATHAEGNGTHAEGYCTHSEGNITHAEGVCTHAEGGYTHAEGVCTHAEGAYTHSEGYFTHAEGYFTHANAIATHAEGIKSVATNSTAFVWQGINEKIDDRNFNIDEVIPYGSHGLGTFNLNPVGGLLGFYIGETNLYKHIEDIAKSTTVTNGGANAYADATFRTKTDNVCHANSFGPWIAKGLPAGHTTVGQPSKTWLEMTGMWCFGWTDDVDGTNAWMAYDANENPTFLTFESMYGRDFITATRDKIATINQSFVTSDNVPSTNGFVKIDDIIMVITNKTFKDQNGKTYKFSLVEE